jgi:hypothetical protein
MKTATKPETVSSTEQPFRLLSKTNTNTAPVSVGSSMQKCATDEAVFGVPEKVIGCPNRLKQLQERMGTLKRWRARTSDADNLFENEAILEFSKRQITSTKKELEKEMDDQISKRQAKMRRCKEIESAKLTKARADAGSDCEFGEEGPGLVESTQERSETDVDR